MHAGLKRALEAVLAHAGPAQVARATHRMRRRDALVLAYHNVVPDAAPAAGDRSLHLPLDQLRRQLDLLQRWCSIVSLTDLARMNPNGGRPRVAITFDDAYRGAVTLGLAELRARDLPASMFVAPGRLGSHTFWWDALAGADGLAADLRRHALEELQGDDGAIRAWAQRTGLALQEVRDERRSAAVGELEAAAYPRLTLGSHSWSHPNLARVSPRELDRELSASHDWLAAHFAPSYVPWLAFPYGKLSSGACEAVRARGFVGALRIDGGWTRLPLADPLAVPRLNVPAGLSVDGFALRLSGLRA